MEWRNTIRQSVAFWDMSSVPKAGLLRMTCRSRLATLKRRASLRSSVW